MQPRDMEFIRRLYAEQEYSKLLDYLEGLERDGCISAELLVRRAMCLPMVEPPRGEFQEIERTFEAALRADPRSIHALIEYGWFKLNVLSDAPFALDLFQRALQLQRDINTDIATGLLKCFQESSRGVSVQNTLSAIMESLIDENKINNYLDQ